MVFLCSPNNPTGTALGLDVVETVYAASRGVVVVDEAYAEFARPGTASALTPEVGSVLEIVIDGLTEAAVARGMRAGLTTLCDLGAAAGVLRVTAGNYGGKLGKFHFRLAELLR